MRREEDVFDDPLVEKEPTKPLRTGQTLLINLENISNDQLEKIPFNLEVGDNLLSAAAYFLRDYKTKVQIKEKGKKNYITKYAYLYRDIIKYLPNRSIKIIDIDYTHFTDWVEEYHSKMVELCPRYDSQYPMIDVVKVRTNQTDMTNLCLYLYSKKLLQYLDKDRVDQFQNIMKDAALSIYKEHFDIEFDPNPKTTKDLQETRDFLSLHIGVKNFPIERDIQDIKSEHMNTACVIRGDLVSFDERSRVEVIKTWWSCNNCQFSFPVAGMVKPYKCSGCGERSTFEDMGVPEFLDYAFIKVQQHMSESDSQISATDISVKLEGKYLIENFYKKYQSSLSVKVTGVVKLSAEKINRSNPNERMLQLNALTVEAEGENTVVQYNERLLDVIATKVNPAYVEQDFEKMQRSICPHLYGLDPQKLAVLLLCVGAEPRVNALTKQRIKGDLVILLVGDPGTGKSEFGIFVLKILPQSIRTIGGKKTTTAAALTSAIDTNNGIPVVVKGVLPRCDRRGAAIIDELDKRDTDDFEVLSIPLDDNQVIPTHKRGIHSNLMARCPVLMSGNASKNQGKWDPSKTIYEQTKYANWLLSRADLIFVMIDDGDMKTKAAMVEHISKSRTGMVTEFDYDKSFKNKIYSDILVEKVENDLINNNYEGIYDTEYLRHAIYYLKKTYKPILKPDSEAVKLLNKEYLRFSQLTLINEYSEEEGNIKQTLMDARAYNALERLSMAIARCRRHHEVKVEDMQKAIDLMIVSRTSLLPQPKQDSDKVDSTNSYYRAANKILQSKSGLERVNDAIEAGWNAKIKKLTSIYRTKLNNFNKALFRRGFINCADCHGNGFITVDEERTETCIACKGNKMFKRRFTKNDIEADILNARVMAKHEIHAWFRIFWERKIIIDVTKNVYTMGFDTIDPIQIADVVEDLAKAYAEADVKREREKVDGNSGPVLASDLK